MPHLPRLLFSNCVFVWARDKRNHRNTDIWISYPFQLFHYCNSFVWIFPIKKSVWNGQIFKIHGEQKITSTLEQTILHHCQILFYLVGDDFENYIFVWNIQLSVGLWIWWLKKKRLRNDLNEGKQKIRLWIVIKVKSNRIGCMKI